MATTAAPARRTRSTLAPKEAVRTEARASTSPGRAVVLGRDGKPIQRVKSGTDKFYVDPSIIPEGWVYQWNTVTVLGQSDPSAEAELARAGWTPVPAERHDGVYLPAGYKGPIVLRGLRLDERPVELELEAREEEYHAAAGVVRGSKEQFGFVPRTRGFEGPSQSNHPSVRQNSYARSEIERVDVPAPKHELEVD